MDKSQVIVEELMSLVVEAGKKAAGEAAFGDVHARGRLYAYHDVLDVLKEQAHLLGVDFADNSLRDFDPDELLRLSVPRKAA